MSGLAQSTEISRPATSPEASVARPAKESLSKRAAEGLKKAVGSAREKLREWVKSPAQKAAEEARQREASIPDEAKKAGVSEAVFRQQRETKVQSDGARARSDSRESAQNLANFAKTEPETRRHLERQGLSAEQVNARIATMRWEAEYPQQAQKAKIDAKDQSPSAAQKKGAETKSTPAAEKTQTKAETEASVQTKVAEAVKKAKVESDAQIAKLTTENAAKDAEIAQLKADLANRPTLENVDARIEKAVAAALAAERAKPAAETPQPKPEEASQTPAKAAVVAEVGATSGVKSKAETEPESEIAALRREVAELRQQLKDAQNGTQQAIESLNVTDPAVKAKIEAEKKKGSAANWLFIFPFVLGSAAQEKNKAVAGRAA